MEDHDEPSCWFEHPEKRPADWKNRKKVNDDDAATPSSNDAHDDRQYRSQNDGNTDNDAKPQCLYDARPQCLYDARPQCLYDARPQCLRCQAPVPI
ncbi:hypothetical protein BDDG_12445 [Blastomyces dermatitidis ATCC 18188]|uniref:Uncharacterized protein n=1 Tax=Ajellomyces dermatitidis (strain ATCC 18188 / CBS 674.68) TaxID=653446 RepID=A0A0J9EPI1_AJEDA|nr:hypothetical protein BDDG_12445 [Blastomyces dermatitidis ATCC 18188]